MTIEDSLKTIIAELAIIKDLLTKKDQEFSMLNHKEAASYLGISTSYLYKLTMDKSINHYKPGGKKIYYLKSDLDKWAMSKCVCSNNQNDLDKNIYTKKMLNDYLPNLIYEWMRIYAPGTQDVIENIKNE